MRTVALLFVAVLALCAAGAVGAQEEDPCTAEVFRCRDQTCAGFEVLDNQCESSDDGLMLSCACGSAPLVAAANDSNEDANTLSFDEGASPGLTQEASSTMDALYAAVHQIAEEANAEEAAEEASTQLGQESDVALVVEEADTTEEAAEPCDGMMMMAADGGQSMEQAVAALAAEAQAEAEEEALEVAEDALEEEEEALEVAEEAAALEEEEETQEEVMPLIPVSTSGFSFSINLGRRFGPGGVQQQQPEVRFVRPTASLGGFSALLDTLVSNYIDSDHIGSGSSGSSSDDSSSSSAFDSLLPPRYSLASLFSGGGEASNWYSPGPFARQQFLLSSPSFMTRRVFYPAVGTMRLATREDLEVMGLLQPASAEEAAATETLAQMSPAETAAEAAQVETATSTDEAIISDAVRRWKRAAGIGLTTEEEAHLPQPLQQHQLMAQLAAQQAAQQEEGLQQLQPKTPILLDAAAGTGAWTMTQLYSPEDIDFDPASDAATAAVRAWYNGKKARRALYCIASIALVTAIIALNAALLMCCASACCRGFGCGGDDSNDDLELDVDVVAVTTPLLVEYQVERVAKPGYEHMSHEDMMMVHEFTPMPREGKSKY